MHNMIQWLQHNRKTAALWSAGVITVFLLFCVAVLPVIIKSQTEKQILKATGRVATVEAVRFNPFGMTLTLNGFRMAEGDAKSPFVQFKSLRVSLSTASLYRFAPVVDELTLQGLQLKLVRTAANRYNFSDILDKQAAAPKKKNRDATRFSLNNIMLQDGSIDFDDQAVRGGKQHTVRNLQLAIPFISNISYLAEKYTDPQFTAEVNGAKLSFSGKAKPLAKTVEAGLNLKLIGLDLPHYLSYLPAETPIQLTKGSLSLDLHLTYRIHQNQKPELLLKGLGSLDNLAITEKNGAPLGSFKRFELQASEVELFNRKAALQQVLLDGLQLHAERDSSGRLNFQRIMPATTEPKQQPRTEKSRPPLQLTIDTVLVRNGGVQFVDNHPPGGFKSALQDINFKLTGLSTAQNAVNNYQLSFTGDQGESCSVQGSSVIAPAGVNCTFNMAGIKLQRAWPYLQNRLTAPVKGTLSLTGTASWSVAEGAAVKDLGLQFKDLGVTYGTQEGTSIRSAVINGISYNQKQHRAEVAEAQLRGGSVRLSRELGGGLSPLSLLKPASVRPATPAQLKTAGTTAGPELSWLVKKISLNDINVTMQDKNFEEPPVFSFKNIQLELSNLSGPKFITMPVSFSTIYGKNAPIRLVGNLTPKPFHYNGSVQFSKLPISDFEGYLPDNLNLYLLAGTLDSRMQLDLGIGTDGKPSGSFSGNAGLRGFHAIDTQLEEDLLKWESLQLDQINGRLAPLNLSIRQIALNNVYSRIAVRKDKTLNLQNLVARSEGQAASSEKQVASSEKQPASARPQIRIDALTIQDGAIDFSDVHLQQHFRSTFHNLGGRVTGLSSDMNARAEVDLRGNLENHSPLQITGAINPLRDDLFVDLTISFKDIELAPATPYSSTYLGYGIDKGKLFLDLKYHIENKNLQASNKVFVDQFTFGEAVQSDKATKLPIRLGVALLKDRNGQIKLDLPVTGRTDDPKLNIWGMVWQVVSNLFIKAATSPLSLLSSMFGSGEDLSSISFAPGSATLTPSEEKKLTTLATGLSQRPGLKLELSGYVDPQRDPEAYRAELLLQKMRHEKHLELVKTRQAKEGDDEERMTFAPGEHTKYLKAVYLKEKFPKPRNMLGMIKELPDAEMQKLIIANTTVGEHELQQLASRRIAAVRQFLTTQGKLESHRIFQKQDAVTRRPKQQDSPASRVELNPVAS